MSVHALASASSAITISDIANYGALIMNAGAVGLWLFAFLRRWIVLPSEVASAEKERDEWKRMFREERQAHDRTRDGLQAALQRTESGVEASRMIATAIAAVQGRDVPPSLQEGHRRQRGAGRGP